MTNNNTKTAKIKNAHRKAFTTFCAMLAATAVITGIAVFTASATQIKSAPEKTSTSVTMAAKPTTTTTTTTTSSAVTTTTTKQAQATAETNKNGKHPGEAGCNYNEDLENAQMTNAYGKHPGECGFGYFEARENADVTNAYGKHPGEAGYCYAG